MNRQKNVSICVGMGKVGIERWELYRQGSRARGYKSLSKFIVDTMDREVEISLSKPKRRSRGVDPKALQAVTD